MSGAGPRQATVSNDTSQVREPTCDLEAIVHALTNHRLKKYFQRVGPGETEKALALYTWNHEVGAAFNVTLQQFEICLRNRVSLVLTARFGEFWFRHRPLSHHNEDIRKALEAAEIKARENRNGFDPSPHDFVAATSMGVWRELLKPQYAGLIWANQLHLAFPLIEKPKRVREHLDEIHSRVHRLVQLRNRIAHHEPIIGWNREKVGDMLLKRHAEMVELISWMDPNFHSWLRTKDRLREMVLACSFR